VYHLLLHRRFYPIVRSYADDGTIIDFDYIITLSENYEIFSDLAADAVRRADLLRQMSVSIMLYSYYTRIKERNIE
jgi:hypothetical protein